MAELAKREGIQVSLRRSAYGGLLAIVLLPERLLVTGRHGDDTDPAAADTQVGVLTGVGARNDARREDLRLPVTGAVPVVNRSTVGILEADAGAGRPSESAGPRLSAHQPDNGVGPYDQRDTAPTTPAPGAASSAPQPAAARRCRIGGRSSISRPSCVRTSRPAVGTNARCDTAAGHRRRPGPGSRGTSRAGRTAGPHIATTQ